MGISSGVCAWFERAWLLLKDQLRFRPMEFLKPQSSAVAGARWSARRSARRARREASCSESYAARRGSSESNCSNFHEWGAASPENSTVSIIRVPSENSWFGYSWLGCLTRWTGGGDGPPRNGGQCRHGGTPMLHWLVSLTRFLVCDAKTIGAADRRVH